jgi:hypothetical protein
MLADAIVIEVARRHDCKASITRNINDFGNSCIPAILPQKFDSNKLGSGSTRLPTLPTHSVQARRHNSRPLLVKQMTGGSFWSV